MSIAPGSKQIFERGFAKINLALHITGRQNGGKHTLDSFIVFADTHDTLQAEIADDISLHITGPMAANLSIQDNLILTAAKMLHQHAQTKGHTLSGARLTLEKHLPVSAGIGGGSADAAATLRALNRLWQLDYDQATLASIAGPLGADVPMCLYSSPLRATGIGQDIKLLTDCPRFYMVLANPGIRVSTAEVFDTLAIKNNPPLPALPAQYERTDPDVWLAWLQATHNDLYAPALCACPAIDDVLHAIRQTSCDFAGLSGSGPTCFGLYQNKMAALTAARYLRDKYPHWWVHAATSRPYKCSAAFNARSSSGKNVS